MSIYKSFVIAWRLSQKSKVLSRLQEFVDHNVGLGFRYKEIGPDDKIVEGRIKLGFIKRA